MPIAMGCLGKEVMEISGGTSVYWGIQKEFVLHHKADVGGEVCDRA